MSILKISKEFCRDCRTIKQAYENITKLRTVTLWFGSTLNMVLSLCPALLPIILHGTKYNTIIWSGTKCGTIAWSGTKCDTIFWGRLPFVTLSFGYRTNLTISWHGTTVTISRSRLPMPIPAQNVIPLCTTTFTKCYNNDWSHPGNGAKCDNMVVTVLLLWSYPDNGAKCVSR